MEATKQPSPPGLADETNARLRELGYSPEEARAERRLRGIRVRGTLVNAVVQRDSLGPVLAMLPPKSWLLALRHATKALAPADRRRLN